LSAIGVATSTVWRSILVQMALPLAASLGFGVAGAVVITTLLYRAVERPVVVATQQVATLAGVVASSSSR
jgi:hypothetical protein